MKRPYGRSGEPFDRPREPLGRSCEPLGRPREPHPSFPRKREPGTGASRLGARPALIAPLLALLPLAACQEGSPQGAMSPPPTVEGGDPVAGAALIAAYGCGSCHTIPGVATARGMVGPPLTDWSRRVYIAGTLPNRPADLIRWISDPQTVEPGTAMPDLDVTAEDARHIAAYLYTVGNPITLGPPHLLPEKWLHMLGTTSPRGGEGGQ